MVKTGVVGELGGQVSLKFPPSGAHLVLQIPLKLTAAGGHSQK